MVIVSRWDQKGTLVGRLLASQLRYRRGRTAALALGILVAAVSFTLLTSAATTSELRVRSTVGHSFRGAYDILVRPPGSFTQLERDRGLVPDNYLAGIFGGITMAQYDQIRSLTGVEVAAPIANLGYILSTIQVELPTNRYLDRDPAQLYRLRLTWLANHRSRYPDADRYVYYTRVNHFVRGDDMEPKELVGNRPLRIQAFNYSDDPNQVLRPKSPLDRSFEEYLTVFSARSLGQSEPSISSGVVGGLARLAFPIMLAAVDPAQEARLVGLDRAVTGGRFLRTGEGTVTARSGMGNVQVLPVLASTRLYLDQSLQVTVERLVVQPGSSVPSRLAAGHDQARAFLHSLHGQVVGQQTVSPDAAYARQLEEYSQSARIGGNWIPAFWSASPVGYRQLGSARLAARPTDHPATDDLEHVWNVPLYDQFVAPPGNEDLQFRQLTNHGCSTRTAGGATRLPFFQAVGRFDPTRLRGFDPLSKVPLETYYPPEATAADPDSVAALDGRPLLPTMNLGGYLAQPPLMLTTLQAAAPLLDPQTCSPGGAQATALSRAPISAIRIRVAGVSGPDRLSRERIRAVAQAITDRTRLPVDITAGSSPTPITVELPKGRYGMPALTVTEGWVSKGAAVVVLTALDRKSLGLFLLVLAVCGLFVSNAALAAVRSRRREIGTLVCLGWSRPRIFAAVLGELVMIALIAGVAGNLLAAALVAALGLEMPLSQTLLVTPVSVALATVAGLAPAMRAARGSPLDTVRAPALEPRRGRVVRTVAGMGAVNLRRLPGRTLLGMVGLAVAVAAFTSLLAITLAFRGTVIGTALGNAVEVRVRGVDVLSALLAIALGAVCVADVLVLNMRERAAELVTLTTTGWTEGHIVRLGLYEGLGMGLLGSGAGVALGLAAAGMLGAGAAQLALAAGLAALTGTGLVAATVLAASVGLGRLLAPVLLAEE